MLQRGRGSVEVIAIDTTSPRKCEVGRLSEFDGEVELRTYPVVIQQATKKTSGYQFLWTRSPVRESGMR